MIVIIIHILPLNIKTIVIMLLLLLLLQSEPQRGWFYLPIDMWRTEASGPLGVAVVLEMTPGVTKPLPYLNGTVAQTATGVLRFYTHTKKRTNRGCMSWT